ncbi:MAG: hypothetical protein QM756_42140 [Polyangiaceae bacterium]
MTLATTHADFESVATPDQLTLPRAAVRVLAACATSRTLCAELGFRDALSEQVFEQLGGDACMFSEAELRGTAFRALVLDRLARDFFERHAQGLGVGLWPVLGTRAHRVEAGAWLDIDTPEVADLRRHLLPERRAWRQASAGGCGNGLESLLGSGRQPLFLVLDESVLPLSSEAMARVLDDVSCRVPSGAELLITFDACAPLRPTHAFQRCSMLELVLREQGGHVARYPRLRFVDEHGYAAELRTLVAGVNAIARLNHGIGSPAIAHFEGPLNLATRKP